MKAYDKRCAELEPRWFTVFTVTDRNGHSAFLAYWGLHDELPEVTAIKYAREGKTYQKYCVSMARSAEEKDAVLKKIEAAAEWEDDEN